MEKLSAADVREVLVEVPSVIRGLVDENRDLKEKVAEYERETHASRIASLMEDKGHDPESSYREKVSELLKDPDRDLRVVEEAVRMGTPAVKLASVSEEETGPGASALEEYLLGG